MAIAATSRTANACKKRDGHTCLLNMCDHCAQVNNRNAEDDGDV
jgi:hypothetical protein